MATYFVKNKISYSEPAKTRLLHERLLKNKFPVMSM